MKKLLEKLRKRSVSFCLKHCRNNICNYMLFKLMTKKEIKRLDDILYSITQHRQIKEKFYG